MAGYHTKHYTETLLFNRKEDCIVAKKIVKCKTLLTRRSQRTHGTNQSRCGGGTSTLGVKWTGTLRTHKVWCQLYTGWGVRVEYKSIRTYPDICDVVAALNIEVACCRVWEVHATHLLAWPGGICNTDRSLNTRWAGFSVQQSHSKHLIGYDNEASTAGWNMPLQ